MVGILQKSSNYLNKQEQDNHQKLKKNPTKSLNSIIWQILRRKARISIPALYLKKTLGLGNSIFRNLGGQMKGLKPLGKFLKLGLGNPKL